MDWVVLGPLFYDMIGLETLLGSAAEISNNNSKAVLLLFIIVSLPQATNSDLPKHCFHNRFEKNHPMSMFTMSRTNVSKKLKE